VIPVASSAKAVAPTKIFFTILCPPVLNRGLPGGKSASENFGG
jgi:hypothetical protein